MDAIYFQKIKWFLEGHFYWYFRRFFPKKTLAATIKMFKVERASPFCLTQGKCIHCGCKTPHLFYSTKPCENGCF
jgi:hypothetical protein